MSARYEFLESGAELVTDADDMADMAENGAEDHEAGYVYLVLGNPYATAAVLSGTRESIAAELRDLLALVEGGAK